MRLSEIEFRDWCRKNQVSGEAIHLIERIRSSQPSRSVRSWQNSVIGKFPSRKMGVTIQFESHKNELPFIYELEQDPDVLEYYDQPFPIKLNYSGKNNRHIGVLHTADFFVIRRDSASWVECKTEDDLLKLAVKQPNRYQLDENDGWRCPPGNDYAGQFDLNYWVRSSKEINWSFQRNFEFLDDYYRKESLEVCEETSFLISEITGKNPAITLEKLLGEVRKQGSISVDDVYCLIAAGEIYVDLQRELLTEPENTRVFISQEYYTAYSNILPVICDESYKPKAINIAPNTEILWDGKAWKIINVGDNNVSLMDQAKEVVPVPVGILKRLAINGDIKEISNLSTEVNYSGINEILMNARAAELKIANQRVEIVRASLAGEEILEAIPERTLRDWKAKYKNAEEIFGNGYIGLIPRVTRGNRNGKLPSLSLDILEQSIDQKYETPEQKTRQVVYLDYEASCKEKGVIAASFVTFCERVKKRSKHKQTLKRQGKRAAYKYEKFYWNLEQDTPRHGERPFHIAHIDHTQLDIELIDTVTMKNLGRPWLTILIDAFSRRILAVYLTFNVPSKVTNMMVLRECVRRHGRLPQIIVVDGGRDFSGTYFETLMACYEVTKKTRPPAQSRYGSIIERLFGTTNKQFIHNLIGNTQIMKNVRQVTKSNNPKNRAVWTLPRLFDRLCEWAYEVYDRTEHSTLNQTPQEAFAQGILNSGERAHRIIPYNDEFKFMTLPSTTKGKAKVDYNRGVKINKIFYWSDEFRNPEVAGISVPVRYDPFDMGIGYAFVNGKWRECRSQHFRVFKNRSEREVYLAGEELRKKQGSRSVTTKVLVKFLESIEAEEFLLKQRMWDREARPILTLVNDGYLIGESPVQAGDEVAEPVPENSGNVITFPDLSATEDETDYENNDFEMYKPL